DFRHLRNTRTTRGGSRVTGFLALAHHVLHEALHVFLEDAVARTVTGDLRQIHTELPGQLAHGRAGMDLLVAAAGRANRGWSGLLGGSCRSTFFLGRRSSDLFFRWLSGCRSWLG